MSDLEAAIHRALVLSTRDVLGVEDFAWISTVSFYPFVLTVRKDSKFKSIGDIVQAAKPKPKGVSYGSAGIGSGSSYTRSAVISSTSGRAASIPASSPRSSITAAFRSPSVSPWPRLSDVSAAKP